MKKRPLIIFTFIVIMLAGICLPAFAADDSMPPLTDPNKWAGKKISVLTGSVSPEVAKEQFPTAECVSFDSTPDVIKSVIDGKTDALMYDLPTLRYAAAINPELTVELAKEEREHLAVVAPKNKKGQALIAEFNAWLASYKAAGKLDQLTKKWINDYQETADIAENVEFPAPKGTLNIVTAATCVPMEFIKDGKLVGFDIELMRDFCEDCGYGINFTDVNFSGLIAGVSSGKYDLGISCITVTEERKKSLLFSDTYYLSGHGIAYKSAEGNAAGFFSTIKSSFIKTFIKEDRWKLFADGILVTLQITCLSVIFGTLAGFLVHYICRKGNKIANAVSSFCRWLIQGMPIVVFLMILFYVIFGKSSLASIWIAVIAFSLLFTCAVQTLLENGEKAVDSGQTLAATALGYSPSQIFFMIILPQAARHFLPVYLGEIDSLLKSTAIVGYIAVVDLTRAGDLVRSITYDAFFPLIAVAILYFILSAVLKTIIRLLTRKTDPALRSEEEILKGVTIK